MKLIKANFEVTAKAIDKVIALETKKLKKDILMTGAFH